MSFDIRARREAGAAHASVLGVDTMVKLDELKREDGRGGRPVWSSQQQLQPW